MSDGRRRSERVLHVRYRRLGVPGICYYCGCPADTVDHVPPLALVPEDPDLHSDLPFWLVPACRECNVLLGCNPILSLEARRAWLLRRYEQRYADELRMPEWSDRELKRLRWTLRSKVLAGLRLKRAVQDRLVVLGRQRCDPPARPVEPPEPSPSPAVEPAPNAAQRAAQEATGPVPKNEPRVRYAVHLGQLYPISGGRLPHVPRLEGRLGRRR